MTYKLLCKICHSSFDPILQHVCTECFGPLEISYDLDTIGDETQSQDLSKQPANLWKFSKLLPVQDQKYQLSTHTGYTPLLKCDTLAKELGIEELYIKADHLNPTGSFKDRPAVVAVSKAQQFGLSSVGCASTGNLAAATAFAASKANLSSYIIVPGQLDPNKIQLAGVFGGNILQIDGSYDIANRYANYLSDLHDIGFVNVNLRPYYVEGSKTITFEIIEQLSWQVPDHIITPLGSGALFTTVDKALNELAQLGWIESNNSKISGSQPLGCNPIALAYQSSSQLQPIEYPNTVVKSLAIGDPASGREVLQILDKRGGSADDPSDQEIINAQLLLAKTEGVFAEGAGGSVLATLIRELKRENISSDETVVLYITGIGYKTFSSLHPYLTLNTEIYSDFLDIEKQILEVTH